MADFDEAEPKETKDKYGAAFQDFGFLNAVEAHKAAGNEAFKKEKYNKALYEYDAAVELLSTVAADKMMKLGKKKWDDVIVLRSTVHLNKSTCYHKLKNWQKSIEEASACLDGNVSDELARTDPCLQHAVDQVERKRGSTNVAYVDLRLPRDMRAKAWFRMAKCYGQLALPDRAKEATVKALAACDDKALRNDIKKHYERMILLKKKQREKKEKAFKGYWDKLEERGGYLPNAMEKNARWDKLSNEQKIRHFEQLDGDDSDDDDDDFAGFVDENINVAPLALEPPPRPKVEMVVQAKDDHPSPNFASVWFTRKEEAERIESLWREQNMKRISDQKNQGEMKKHWREKAKKDRESRLKYVEQDEEEEEVEEERDAE